VYVMAFYLYAETGEMVLRCGHITTAGIHKFQ
jgi:hypothetical protein